MTKQELMERIAAAVNDADLTETDIPAIDLYLDQILSLVADKNVGAAPRYRERALTKTMVNNYSKDGLIRPIAGKKYSREHIIEMLLVYALKNTLSIGEIKRVLTGVREECGFTGEDLAAGYRRFLSVKETNRQRTGELVQQLLKDDGLSIENDRDFFVALLDILSLSAYLKAAAQELLETRYADPDAAERELREKEKAEKREQVELEKAEKREQAEQEKAEKREQAEQEKAKKRKEKEIRKRVLANLEEAIRAEEQREGG